ncbi:hypothetical protein J437_LFUL007848 [Ladona fulva]|uniref:Uncharacterized protein n=1 Tax=Ladona fulva TaxID=123851 RepID=A0A8K0K4Q6_LADFU|nr:hypothetical protein J437_LFUL007848 [Ladona fulva]
MKQIYNGHGFKGLFAGIVPRVLKVAPACAVMVMSFEYGKRFFQLHNRREYIDSLKDDTWDLMEKKTNNVNANSLR